MKKYWSVLLLVIIATIVIAYGFVHEKKTNIHGVILPIPKVLKPFSLRGTDNKIFTNKNLHGQWTMLFFGFTRCQSICPVVMHELATMYKILQNNGVQPLPKIIMVSIDPKYDNTIQLANYVKTFNSAFYGVLGNALNIHAFASDFGIAYNSIITQQNSDDIQHTGVILLCNPQGKLVVIFTTPHNAKQLATDYRWLVF